MANIPKLKFDSDRINQDIDITEVLRRYRPDLHISSNGKCLCPVHKEKTPSAQIYKDKNIIKCFGCGFCGDPIGLARKLLPEQLSFREVCEQLLGDMGLNYRNYCNIDEVEAAKNARRANCFHDHFPITEEDIETLGLHNPHRQEEMKFAVDAPDYYKYTYGEIPPRANPYNPDGTAKKIYVSHRDAVYMGIIESMEDNEKGLPVDKVYYPQFDSLQTMWRDDKAGVEELLICKGFELIHRLDENIVRNEIELQKWHGLSDIYKENAVNFAKMLYSKENVTEAQIRLGLYADKCLKMIEKTQDMRELKARVYKVIHKVKRHRAERDNFKKRNGWER